MVGAVLVETGGGSSADRLPYSSGFVLSSTHFTSTQNYLNWERTFNLFLDRIIRILWFYIILIPIFSSKKENPPPISILSHSIETSNLTYKQRSLPTTAHTTTLLKPHISNKMATQSDLAVLLDMGFEKERAEIAVKKTGGCKSLIYPTSIQC